METLTDQIEGFVQHIFFLLAKELRRLDIKWSRPNVNSLFRTKEGTFYYKDASRKEKEVHRKEGSELIIGDYAFVEQQGEEIALFFHLSDFLSLYCFGDVVRYGIVTYYSEHATERAIDAITKIAEYSLEKISNDVIQLLKQSEVIIEERYRLIPKEVRISFCNSCREWSGLHFKGMTPKELKINCSFTIIDEEALRVGGTEYMAGKTRFEKGTFQTPV